MVNNVILLGRMTGSPTIKKTANNIPLLKFTLTTSETWKDKSTNQVKSRNEKHRIVCWDKIANVLKEKLNPGSLVYVEGKIRSRLTGLTSEKKQKVTEIIATYVRVLQKHESEQIQEARAIGRQDV